ncbi:hypothetical protein DV515_00004445 [Chloebia gouldiae]|uniref:Transmembrane protein 117 n=1 Tax=Chloebia gouldiae TaxID=44316 RepID=A0A3L8SR84_CHLGU|nr:hypothetical protein DV515_00004445 [Chloebia gouldiae]
MKIIVSTIQGSPTNLLSSADSSEEAILKLIVPSEEIKTSRTDLSFEIQLWVQVSGVYVLIMAINMPAPATASGALVNEDEDHSACHKSGDSTERGQRKSGYLVAGGVCLDQQTSAEDCFLSGEPFRDDIQERELSFQSKLFFVCAKVELVENSVRFRTVLFTLTSVVVLVITTDWISWDKLNRGFLPSDEVSRAFLASFILVFDLLIVMQVQMSLPVFTNPEMPQIPFNVQLQCVYISYNAVDWEFPHFMGDVEVNLPGLPSAHMQFKVPYFQKILKEEYHIHITGKWFNYGIIFLVLILDLNMWKNQIFYKPHEYGQYIGPGQKIYTVKDSESLRDLNRTKLSWEWRSNNTNPLTNRTYAEGDMFLHSRFTGSSLDVKCLAFIPSLLAFALFGFFIWFFGRFQKTDQGMENLDKSYTRMKRKSPSDMGMTRENTQVLEEPLNFQEPHMVSIKSDLSEIVFNSSLLTSENLNAQLNEQDSPLQPVPESSVPKNNPVT